MAATPALSLANLWPKLDAMIAAQTALSAKLDAQAAREADSQLMLLAIIGLLGAAGKLSAPQVARLKALCTSIGPTK